MAVMKCKMCGGDLILTDGQSVAECEYCGTKQTLPKLNDDRRANLYDRANHFRRSNEFDKAMGMYERILSEDTTDAEAYWSLVLCRYGIEYVEDPATHKRLPTVNRAQYTSIFDDDNYKSALQYADSYQRHIYEEEAKAINEIQKGILAISQKEEPFDVFICYKETDRNGRRTPDSVLANDLYHQLTQEGFKVFFSRITLEDKLGVAYEPYIFAALNSARVMVVVGTKPEYFNAVWVKNEWSRYLSLIKNGAKKILIPAYRDMDPYDLPEEFSHLQAQDMGKLGFMQDLIRGIKKLAKTEEPKVAVVKETVIAGTAANTAPLLKRAFMFLEDEDWDSADEYCEKVLDIDPECARAYLGKLMAELQVCKQEDLRDQEEPFDEYNNYLKAIRFADATLKEELKGYISYINDRNEQERLENAYYYAKRSMENANTAEKIKEAARSFEAISEYKDSAALARECFTKAKAMKKDEVLAEAKSKMTGDDISNYESAISILGTIPGWKDADESIVFCKEKIQELKAKREAEKLERKRQEEIARQEAVERAKRNKKIAIIASAVVCAVIAIVLLVSKVIIPTGKYNDAVALMEAGSYEEAAIAFEELGDFKDSVNMKSESNYLNAVNKIAEDKYPAAMKLLEVNPDYKDSRELYTDACYQYAHQLWNKGDYRTAQLRFEECGGYLDAQDWKLVAESDADCIANNWKYAYQAIDRVSDAFREDHQAVFEEQYTQAVYGYAKKGSEENSLNLVNALHLLEKIPNPGKAVKDLIAQYEIMMECVGKYRFKEDSEYGPYYLDIKAFYIQNDQMYAQFTFNLFAGKFEEDGIVTYSSGEYPVTIKANGRSSYNKKIREFTFDVNSEKATADGPGGFGYHRGNRED